MAGTPAGPPPQAPGKAAAVLRDLREHRERHGYQISTGEKGWRARDGHGRCLEAATSDGLHDLLLDDHARRCGS